MVADFCPLAAGRFFSRTVDNSGVPHSTPFIDQWRAEPVGAQISSKFAGFDGFLVPVGYIDRRAGMLIRQRGRSGRGELVGSTIPLSHTGLVSSVREATLMVELSGLRLV